MGRLLSTVIAVAVLLGLGTLAVMAMPSGSAPVIVSAFAAPLAAEPDAPAVPAAFTGPRYNHIALPLNPGTSMAPFTAQGLLNYLGSGATQVANLNASSQALDFWDGAAGYGVLNGIPIFDPAQYPLQAQHPYLVLLDNTYPPNKPFSIVGDVPTAGQHLFTMVGKTPCNYNEVMIPLDQYSNNITNGAQLASAIGNVDIVAALYPVDQSLDFWDINAGYGVVQGVPIFSATQFPVKIGYPYFVCVNAAGNGRVWP